MAMLLLAVRVGGAASTPVRSPLLAFLDEAITWYRQQVTQARLVTEPSDVAFADAVRRQARQAVALAFDYARADATLAAPPQGSGAPPVSAAGGASLQQHAADAERALAAKQATVDGLQRRLERARAAARATLQRRLAEAKSELDLARVRRDALKTLSDFAAQAGNTASSGLLGQIDELQRSVPGLASPEPAAPPQSASASAVQKATDASIVALATDLMAGSRKLGALASGARLTTSLRAAVDRGRAPLLTEVRSALQSVGAGAASPASAADAERAARVEDVARRVRSISTALVPLGKLAVVLDAQAATLSEWRAAADMQYDLVLRRLLIHVGLLACAVGAILAASAAWRRATLRYVQDPRRRRQSLLLRRIVMAIALLMVVLFSFVTELGSVATFAGFITAGLAVALQNVILSVAAYFFLIGRYGIGVGDRVQIGGVTGEVIDVGLVRLHLMELRAEGLPSGRVVVFSNAVAFQPGANFFKQLPGSSYTWHQVKLTVSADTDYRYAERRVLDAVEAVYGRYRDAIERQHRVLAAQLPPVAAHPPRPESRLQLTSAGPELTIRFPVPLDRAPAVDDEVTRALLDAIDREPRLRLAGSGTPTIQPAAEPARA